MIRITVLMLAAAVAGALSPGVYSQEIAGDKQLGQREICARNTWYGKGKV